MDNSTGFGAQLQPAGARALSVMVEERGQEPLTGVVGSEIGRYGGLSGPTFRIEQHDGMHSFSLDDDGAR